MPRPDLRDRLHAAGFRNLSVLGPRRRRPAVHPARRSARRSGTPGACPRHDLVALYVGRLAPEKNLAAGHRGLPGDAAAARHHARLVIVGDGPLRAALQRAHPDLLFCGVHTGEPLATHYASADVFLFPSETETFGNVTLEAMASGLAVVAYDYAAARMHIAHGETGVLVPLGDARAFVTAAAALARVAGGPAPNTAPGAGAAVARGLGARGGAVRGRS